MSAKKEIADLLVKWYEKQGRKYPWRDNTEPYRVLIAEIMLQRTKADQVVPVYLSFLGKYRDLAKLHQASEREIGEYFGHLGLIHRTKLVKLLAEDIVHRFYGKIPESRKELLSLPSVGEYVADALLCFAFNQKTSTIDSNVCRVVGRVFGLEAKGEARRDPAFRKLAEDILPETRVKEFNWAIIDLAAMVCIPRNPRCPICLLNRICKFAEKLQITNAQNI